MVADLRAESDELDALVADLPADAMGRADPRAGLDHRPPDRPPAVDRPRRADRRHRRGRLRRSARRGGRGPDRIRRRGRRGARRDARPPNCWPTGARTRGRAARRAADGGRRPQAAVVRAADERRVDGHRTADGDLGARPRRRRRARRRRGPPTARLRSIAHIGVRTRDFAFAVNGLAPPADPFRVELSRTRRLGMDVGSRGCGAAGHRVGARTSACWSPSGGRGRRWTSPPRASDAEQWLAIAQAFAGPPGPGPRLSRLDYSARWRCRPCRRRRRRLSLMSQRPSPSVST